MKFLSEKRILMSTALVLILCGSLWEYIPSGCLHALLPAAGVLIFVLVFLWDGRQKKEQSDFANDICGTVDALMNGESPENYQPYEDSQVSKVQGKLLQYYDRMQQGREQSEQDKQINKLDFLMQSLIKMSRLETGTFTLHMEEGSLYNTIAQAVNGIWATADQKQIRIDVACDSHAVVRHDAKWTAEALGNILDNAVKYTPKGGSISICVRPWQFYTRIDITDTGIGIAAGHYNDVFQRFYRAEEVAGEEGVGLGLYLARGIITRQKGYVSVKSKVGEGTTFSVFLLQ